MSPDSDIKLDCKFAKASIDLPLLFLKLLYTGNQIFGFIVSSLLGLFYAKTRTIFQQTWMH